MKMNILRGIGGEFEIGRVSLALSSFAGIITPVVFQSLDMAHNGFDFDVTAWCVAYPGGLAVLNSAGILSIGSKDKKVAEAKQTQATTV